MLLCLFVFLFYTIVCPRLYCGECWLVCWTETVQQSSWHLSQSFTVSPDSREQKGPPFEWGTLELAFASCASQRRLGSLLPLPALFCQLGARPKAGQGGWASRGESSILSGSDPDTGDWKQTLLLLAGSMAWHKYLAWLCLMRESAWARDVSSRVCQPCLESSAWQGSTGV